MTSVQQMLLDAERAYDRGDFATARKTCRTLLGSKDLEASGKARLLLRRSGIDPAQAIVITGCLLFFVWAVWRYAL